MEALRIAIVLQNPEGPPDWAMRLIEQIDEEPHLQLQALITPVAGGHDGKGHALIRAWHSLERKVVAKSRPADAGAYAAATAGLPVLASDDIASIQSLGLDVILDLSGDLGQCCDASLARHGIWFLDFQTREGGVAGLAAILSGEPVTRIALFRRTAQTDRCTAISTASINTKFIAALNELFMLEKAVPLIMRALRRTRRSGAPDVLDDLEFAQPGTPGVPGLLKYLAGVGRTGGRRVLDKALEKAGMRPGMFFLKSDGCGWSDFGPAKASPHVSGKNSYYADPFLWERDGQLYCFFEEYDYRTSRGHISAGRFEGSDLTDIEVALRTDYHLSFPFLFEHAGELYMMPETSETRRIEIWKCREFPGRWDLHATALEGIAASDSTLNLIDGDWWLFTNISKDPFLDMNSELHIFKADGPDLKSLEPHSANPVVLNSRQARNAGRILEMEGKLYRPSQDNSHGYYGYGLQVMEIRQLSLDEYEETAVKRFSPDFEPGIIGCHHLDIRSGRVIMDVRKSIGGLAH
jgi:hypothetical protein